MGDCGVVFSYDPYVTRESLHYSRHRGPHASGLAVRTDDGDIDIVKWWGQARDFRWGSLSLLLPTEERPSLGHGKYRTRGDRTLQTAHPLYFGRNSRTEIEDGHMIVRGTEIAVGHNGEFRNYSDLRTEIEESGLTLTNDCDSQALPYLFHIHGHDIVKVMPRLEASYFAVVMDKNGAVAFRDPFGNRPGWYGLDSKGRPMVASEDYSIIKVGGKPIREIGKGEALRFYLDPNREPTSMQILEPIEGGECIFEEVYLSKSEINEKDPNSEVSSTFAGINVRGARESLGRALATEFLYLKDDPWRADIVTYAPYSPYHASKAFADEIGLTFKQILYKHSEPGEKRSFMAEEEQREDMIWNDLYIIPIYKGALRGKRVIVIDDSRIRSTVTSRFLYLLKAVGEAEAVYALNYSDIIGGRDNGVDYGCDMGVAMPNSDTFAATRYGRNIEALRIGAGLDLTAVLARHPEYATRDSVDPTRNYELDFLGHLPGEKMVNAVGIPGACYRCMGGPELPFIARKHVMVSA